MAGATLLHALLLASLSVRSSAASVAVSSVASTTSKYLPDARLADGKPGHAAAAPQVQPCDAASVWCIRSTLDRDHVRA